MVKLEYKAYIFVSECSKLFFAEAIDHSVDDLDCALVRKVQGAQDVQQCALTGPGFAGNTYNLTLRYLQIDTPEHLYITV